MASSIMHIAVANEIYKKIENKINIDYYDYILGSIAPDLSKILNESKEISHFLDNNQDIPNIDRFLKKYINTLDNSFNLGYFIHLYTDRLFYRDYLPLFAKDDIISSNIKCLNGEILNLSLEERKNLLYNDYSNLNITLIDEYNLNLDLFYNEFKKPKTNLTEIDINKLNLLIDNMGIIIENSHNNKNYIINKSSIKSFIDDCIEEIYTKIISLDII